MWSEFLRHPCWKEIEDAIKERLRAHEHALLQAAFHGDTIRAARVAAAIMELQFLLELPERLQSLKMMGRGEK